MPYGFRVYIWEGYKMTPKPLVKGEKYEPGVVDALFYISFTSVCFGFGWTPFIFVLLYSILKALLLED